MNAVLALVCKVLLALLCLGLVLSSRAQPATSESDGTYPVIHDAKVIPGNGEENCPPNEVINAARMVISAEIQQLFYGSCNEVFQRNPNASAGFYWIFNSMGDPVLVYCGAGEELPLCDSANGTNWIRVANLNMTDPDQSCPVGWKEISSPRTCGRFDPQSCVSATFPTNGISYSRVSGRAKGYQFGRGIFGFYESPNHNIDGHYVDGVVITRGSPRQHVWTFAAARTETTTIAQEICPCTRADGFDFQPPSFVRPDYFCDGLAELPPDATFNTDNPLWDGAGCGGTSTCCEFNNPPWFCRILPESTTDDIEVRICGFNNPTSNDTPVEMLELYIS